MPGSSSAFLPAQEAADQPIGFTGFCVRFPDQCSAPVAGKAVIALDTQTWVLLNAVNQAVNSQIWPEDDLKHYGRAEYWTIPTDNLGDCDDYAVTKRKDLIEAGLPMKALRLAVVNSAASGRHAVLTVATDKGDFVLDNLNDDIRSWTKTDYVWLERQDGADPMKWVSLRPRMVAQSQPDDIPTAAATGTGSSRGVNAP
jgi:Predicted periplasmic protein